MKLGGSTFLNTLSRLAKVPTPEEAARYPNWKTPLCHALSRTCHAPVTLLSRSGRPPLDPGLACVTLSHRQVGSQMRDLEAELDLASIDKVDVRNELRRFTMLWEAGADLQNFGPYLNLCMYAKTCDRPAVSFCHAPVKPKKPSVCITPQRRLTCFNYL